MTSSLPPAAARGIAPVSPHGPRRAQGSSAGQGERMNIFLENKLETAIALNMLSEFAMVDVAIYTIL
jgi:hypothetical protein